MPIHPTVRAGIVPPPPPEGLVKYDYADYFEGFGARGAGDEPTASQVLHHAMGGLPSPLEVTVRSVLRYVLGFRLAPADTPGHVLGWRVASEEPERIVLATEGWLAEAHLVLSSTDGWYGVATYIRWKHRAGPVIWVPVRPVHQAVARYLVGQAVRPMRRVTASG